MMWKPVMAPALASARSLQKDEQILIGNVETTRAALRGLQTVAIDTARFESVLGNQFQPLATPAAKIDHG